MKTKNVDMLSGSITRGLITLALPIMIMNVGQVLFNVVDLAVLKHFSDDRAVGAVGASGNLITLCTALLIGLTVGANVTIAKRIGTGNRKRVIEAVMTALSLALLGGFLLMIVGAVFAGTFLKMMNCPQQLLAEATLYFRMYFFGVPFLMLYNFCAAILRAAGDTKRPMAILLFGGAVKGMLSLLFVGFFGMRVTGVGTATILSNTVIGLLAFRAINHTENIHVDLKKLRLYPNELKDILFVGIPSGMQSSMYAFANVIIMTVVNSFGPDATTGVSIANQFDGIQYQIIYAPSLAVVPYVAQNIGAGNIKRMRESVRKAVFLTAVIGAISGALFVLFSGKLASIMSDTPEVIRYAGQKMLIVSGTYFICGINEILGGTLKGMRKPFVPMVATLTYMCFFRFVWVYLIYPHCPQSLTFLYLVWPIGWSLSIVTLLFFYFPAVKKLEAHFHKEQKA